jgi:DNA-binding transcriptional LysR family regulator
MDRMFNMKVFERVVGENGFAAAARKLDVTPAAVTRHIAELERHLGVRLLHRTTRRLSLTPAGDAFLERVKAILALVDEAEDAVGEQAGAMSGLVRVQALPGLATHLVAPAVATFRERHPHVCFVLRSTEDAHRAVGDHDLSLVIDQAPLDADLVVRPVAQTKAVLCASPDYLRRHGEPRTPADLNGHALGRLSLPGVAAGPLILHDESDPVRVTRLDIPPAIEANDHEAILRATLIGAVLSSQVVQVVAPMFRDGTLKRVLAPWAADRYTLVAALPSRRYVPTRARAFLEHLTQHAQLALQIPDGTLG